MRKPSLTEWITLNAFGLGLAFVAYLQAGWLLDFGFDFAKHWQSEIEPSGNYISGIATVPLMLVVAGMVFGSSQAIALRHARMRAIPWIVATIVGFLLLVSVIMPLEVAGIMGNIPGPVEPIIFTIGGCSFAGVVQYYLLGRQGFLASRWLTLWILGLVASLIPTILMFFMLQELLDFSLTWPMEVFLNGFMCAGVAALLSGKALFIAISGTDDVASLVEGDG